VTEHRSGHGRVSARQLNRATLDRQLLLRRATLPVAAAVRHLVGLQAQEPASPYLALWNRIDGFEPSDLDAAYASATVIKATLMRITLHAVHADDYPAFHAAMAPSLRASRLFDRRFKTSGLSAAELDELEPGLLASSRSPRTGVEITAALEAGLGQGAERAWWALRTYAPLRHAPGADPWSFGRRPSFVAAPATWPPGSQREAVGRLVMRYLHGFGPASVADVAQFTLLTRGVVREALAALGAEVVALAGPAGGDLFDLAGATLPEEATPAPPRLLPMWDSVLLAYAHRDRLIPPQHRALVIRRNGDVLPTLLVDGFVAGVWRLLDGAIEATPFEPLSAEAWDGLAAEAAALLPLLQGRDPKVYSRHVHWWRTLPSAGNRRLPG
jgi:hypothetical protein